MIPISKPTPTVEGEQLLIEAYRSGRWSQGPLVERFEDALAEVSGCDYAVAVSNGTVAIEAMLRAVGQPGDIVLTSPLTFRATIKGIEHAGMVPLFEDVNPDNLVLSFDGKDRDVDFYMPVDIYGRDSGHKGDDILSDSAQSVGIDMSGRRASSISFYSGKNVGCGEGGAVVTNDKAIADKIKLLRNQGMAGPYEYESEEGYNWRMTEFQAAVAIPQLETLKQDRFKRNENAELYSQRFAEIPSLIVPEFPDLVQHSWHQYTLRHPERDTIVDYLRASGIDARIYYPELVSPRETWKETPVAAQAVKEIFSIPVHQHLLDRELEFIVASVMFAVGMANSGV